MGEGIAFSNGRFSDFQGLVTLTLNRVILHTVMHHSSTSTYINWNWRNFCERTDVRTNGRTYGRFNRSTGRCRPKKEFKRRANRHKWWQKLKTVGIHYSISSSKSESGITDARWFSNISMIYFEIVPRDVKPCTQNHWPDVFKVL